MADEAGADLVGVVAGMLTGATTQALPEAWHGDFSVERASMWIDARDRESPTLLVIDRRSSRPLGLVILFEIPIDASTVSLRIGYLLIESVWGRGLASELVAGLADWATTQPSIRTLVGGVATSNPASTHVLRKNGFAKVDDDAASEEIFQLGVE